MAGLDSDTILPRQFNSIQKSKSFNRVLFSQIIDGFILNTNNTCQNKLMYSWNLTGLWNLSQPIEDLCQTEEVIMEWTTNNLISNIADLVSKMSELFLEQFKHKNIIF